MPWCLGKQAMKMKPYGQRSKQLYRGTTQWELDKSKAKMSPFQHALNDGSSVPTPRSYRGRETVGQHHRPQTTTGKRHWLGAEKQTTEWKTVALITCETLSLTPFHLGLLERHRRDGAELLSLAMICRDISRDSFTLPEGLFKPLGSFFFFF